jgi:CHAT domain-containing protein/tetratricopeptide (TPR) repeat protein
VRLNESYRSCAQRAVMWDRQGNQGMSLAKIAQLNTTVAELYRQGRYQEAIEPAKLSLNLVRQLVSEHHQSFSTCLNTLGLLYYSMGEYAVAKPLYERAIGIHRAVASDQDPNFATFLNNLAALYKAEGDYRAAEPLYKQALEIRREVVGEQHRDFAASLDNLAGLHAATGDYRAAESLSKKALEIYRAVVGDRHPDFAICLDGLAGLYETMGEYAAAERLHKQAIEIDRAVLGERHPDFATKLNNLALLYKSMGNYAAAEPLYKQSIEIYRDVSERHPNYAASLDNLAMLFVGMGKDRYAAAEVLCKRALEIRRAVLGKRHPAFALSLNNLAGLYEAMGEYAQAQPLYKRAMKIRRAVLGKLHPNFATSLNNLARLYLSRGKYAAAEPLCKQALEIRCAVFGEQHPSFAASLNSLAGVRAATGKAAGALAMMEQAVAIENRLLGQVFSVSSEKQRTAYLNTIRGEFKAFLSLVSQWLPHSQKAVCSALSLVLQRKAIEAEVLATQRDAVLSGKYPEAAHMLRELTLVRSQIAQKTLAGVGYEGLQAHQQLLAEWNAQRERLEAEVARQVPEMNIEKKLRSIDRHVVAMALPTDATLVEFVRFDVLDFKAVPARGEKRWKPARYLAFVMHAGEPENIDMIDLGEAEPIDRMIATFRSIITVEKDDGGNRGLGALPSYARKPEEEDVGLRLRESLFDPLLEAIGDHTRLMMSPDGDLSRLPFEVLPTNDGRRLIDEYRISYLSAGRDVVRFNFKSGRKPARSLVAADPDFDLGAKSMRAAAASAGRRSRDFNRGATETFHRLSGTKLEGRNVAAMLDAELWTEGEVLDARLKRCRSPRILHLATHGFFLEDQKRDPQEESFGFDAMSFSQSGMQRLADARLENPLLRSGLALAGVNTWLESGELMEEAEDGLLTAEDVSGLDLLDTELVVLSACDTGLGEVHVGEGVFGLQRAFVLAGAKTLVMSLWEVSDEQTRELMEDFYRRILGADGKPPQSRADALREAQLAIKARHLEPFHWGAFICQGYDGPLAAS